MIFRTSLFTSRGQQAFEIPEEFSFSEGVKKVRFEKSGASLIVSPVIPRMKKAKA
jgi:virulence-associated protein VagC